MIDFDPTEFQDGLTAQSLKRIALFLGENVEDVSNALDPPAVKINVESHSVSIL